MENKHKGMREISHSSLSTDLGIRRESRGENKRERERERERERPERSPLSLFPQT
jgi:hypothetical protein